MIFEYSVDDNSADTVKTSSLDAIIDIAGNTINSVEDCVVSMRKLREQLTTRL